MCLFMLVLSHYRPSAFCKLQNGVSTYNCIYMKVRKDIYIYIYIHTYIHTYTYYVMICCCSIDICGGGSLVAGLPIERSRGGGQYPKFPTRAEMFFGIFSPP